MNIIYETWNLWRSDRKELMLIETKEFLESWDLDASEETVERKTIEIVNENYWESFLADTKFIKDVSIKPCLISGNLGLWDGTHEIVPEEVDNLLEVIKRIVSDPDCDDFGFYEDENGDLLVNMYHHDGVNKFKITYIDGSPICWRKQVWGKN